MKNTAVPIDQAGRIVLPKDVRDDLAIKPGDFFTVSVHGSSVTLTPNRQASGLVRKGKALVFSVTGEKSISTEAINDILTSEREDRNSQIAVESTKPKSRP